MNDFDLQEAFMFLLANGHMYSAEAAVAQYFYLRKDEDISVNQITRYFHWPMYRTSKTTSTLLIKKVIKQKKYGVFQFNEDWKAWLRGKIASTAISVSSRDFNDKITPELVTKLIRWVQSRSNKYEDAEDIVHTALYKAKVHYNSFRPGTSFESWIYEIVKNTMYDFGKKKKETQLFDDEINRIATDDMEYSTILVNKADIMQCQKQIAKLSKYYQNLLKLWSCDMPYDKVSVILGIPKGTVKSQVFRAKQKLQEIIQSQKYLE